MCQFSFIEREKKEAQRRRQLMQIDGDNFDVVVRFICLGICFGVTDFLAHFHAFHHSSEYRVLIVQPWLFVGEERECMRWRTDWAISSRMRGTYRRQNGHKELAAVGVRSGIGH